MRKVKYSNKHLGKVKIVEDFLPRPNELVLKEDTVKVTLLLSRGSLEYFKREADKHDAHYQTMIRTLLDKYVQHYS
jgi:predicted DNA binding CopG/RHH family protein